MIKQSKGITLVALVITIIILLILAGVAIASLGGENGLIARIKQAKQTYIKSEMKEQLTLALSELQLEKNGKAILDNVTQEWANNSLKEYNPILSSDADISGKKIVMTKNDIMGTYLIDEKLNIVEIENEGSVKFSYDVGERVGENVKILIHVQDKENGLIKIEFPDKDAILIEANNKEEKGIDYEVKIGVEYKIKITSGNGEETEKIILIQDYYYKITKNLGEGIEIDNPAIKVAYNKPYKATLILDGEYILDTLKVTMGGQEVAVDKATGIINIEKVTGDIEIKATSKKLEIQVTTPIVSTNTSATSSDNPNTVERGTPVYIKFTATLSISGGTCTIDKTIPYEVSTNGTYKFTITGTYGNKTITKEIEVKVEQYKITGGFVQYDAGEWTEKEIEELQSKSLYDINVKKEYEATFKLKNPNGKNFTFGGFTYKGDTTNESYINDGTVITSRNQSVAPRSGYGIPSYDGWQILESHEENGKVYVTKLTHAGSPENFVYYYVTSSDNNNRRAEYLLSNGQRETGYNKLSSGETINPRNWDMYKDKDLDAKGYIKEVHMMTYNEAYAITGNRLNTNSLRKTGAYYWLGSAHYGDLGELYYVLDNGFIGWSYANKDCWGVRPVISLESGVYITSGEGTEESPYVLGKE